jgi:hypothetical protein
MLWIDPYDLPVFATSVRILAPPSYALRNSVSISSLDFVNFFIGTSPRVVPRPIPSVGSGYTTRVKLMKRLAFEAQASSMRSR